MRMSLFASTLPLLTVLPPLAAQDSLTVLRPQLLPRACELDLALSAAPDHLRSGAAVFVLEEQGYVRIREARNGFTCIVNRDDPRVLKPTCFDSEGSETIVPKILRFGELMMEGESVPDINRALAAAFERGELVSPRRPGVAYMLSNYNRPVNQAGALGWFPPHLMFYAPDLTNRDIGGSWANDWRLPVIGYQGPQGFMIVRVQPRSVPKEADLPDCPDWVRANPPPSSG